MGRKNRRIWRRVVWRSREKDLNQGYAIQGGGGGGGVESMSYGPRMADEKISCVVGVTPNGGYMDGTGGGKPPARSGTY